MLALMSSSAPLGNHVNFGTIWMRNRMSMVKLKAPIQGLGWALGAGAGNGIALIQRKPKSKGKISSDHIWKVLTASHQMGKLQHTGLSSASDKHVHTALQTSGESTRANP